ncbi:regulatory protein RecX [Micromonospora sp. NBC_00421]|uniref:regulatory protein RecX n=1 Tax=Micromonospora sp. NBC_00421 TaxID=2975976 RepID=UPI002E1BC59A
MAGRRARTGRGWDAAPPRAGTDHSSRADAHDPAGTADGPPWAEGTSSRRGRRGRPDGAESTPVESTPRDEGELAREICLRQLAVRPRTRAELAGALAKKGISDEVSAQVLDRYDEVGIIDDAAFARAWVSSRHNGRGLARRALANELRQRGVDGEVASEALGELDEETEAATARALVDRKLRTARGEPDAVFRRLVGMLARKGYPPGVAIRAVKDALAAQSAEAAEFAEQIDADALAEAEGERG